MPDIERGFGLFLEHSDKPPEIGYTTGTCAAASSCAAARMLISKKQVPFVFLTTPKGHRLVLEVLDIKITDVYASCAVRKNSGTDPDITNGILVYAKVELDSSGEIIVLGGDGIGRVTLPGLDQSVGSYAINSVPRKMICSAVKQELGTGQGAKVTISIPDGKQIAEKTFNPRLGIVGGLSILGTSGIVKPMSSEALVKTIELEISIRKENNFPLLPVTPGNYGAQFLSDRFGFSLDIAVMSSNFIYDTVKIAESYGIKRILFCGHIGKLVKIASGVKNTHSKFGDHRMEILVNLAEEACSGEVPEKLKKAVLESATCDHALEVLQEYHLVQTIGKLMVQKIKFYMERWTDNTVDVEIVVFSQVQGIVGISENAVKWMNELQRFKGLIR